MTDPTITADDIEVYDTDIINTTKRIEIDVNTIEDGNKLKSYLLDCIEKAKKQTSILADYDIQWKEHQETKIKLFKLQSQKTQEKKLLKLVIDELKKEQFLQRTWQRSRQMMIHFLLDISPTHGVTQWNIIMVR